MQGMIFPLRKPSAAGALGEGLWLFILVFLLLSLLRSLKPTLDGAWVGAAWIALGLLVGTFLVLRQRARPPPRVELFPDRVVLVSETGREVALQLRELMVLGISGAGPDAQVHLGTSQKRLVVPVASFERAEDPAILLGEARARLVAFTPDGANRVAMLEAHARALELVPRGRPVVTEAILTVLVLVYGLQELSGAFQDMFGLSHVALGANAPLLVREGEYFRLVTGSFLHAFFLHFVLNAVAIWSLGSAMERSIGPHRLLIVYVLSAIGGSVVSVFVHASGISMGASGAAFGLLGGFFLLHLRKMVPRAFRQTRLWWAVILGINAALPLVIIQVNAIWGRSIPYIDLGAHVGGFLVGAGVLLLILPERRVVPLSGRAPRAVRGLAYGLLGVVAAAFVWCAAVHGSVTARRLELAAKLLEHPGLGPDGQNVFAWLLATEPGATESQLQTALTAAEQALEASASHPEMQTAIDDTVATLEYRLGRLDDALARQLAIVSRRPDRVMASQLARFAHARWQRSGPASPAGWQVDDVTVRVVERPDGSKTLTSFVGSSTVAAGSVFVLAKDEDALVGLLRFPLPERSAKPSVIDLGPPPFGFGASYVAVLFTDVPEEMRHWAMDPEILKLP